MRIHVQLLSAIPSPWRRALAGWRRHAAILALAALLAGGSVRAAAAPAFTGLPRAAALGFAVSERDGALLVQRVDADSPAALAGLRDGDRLVSVGGRAFAKAYIGRDLLRRLDGGVPVSLGVERDGHPLTLRFTPAPRPAETLSGVASELGVIETPDGARLRTLLTRPIGAGGPLPAIFVTQWVSCGTIEIVPGDTDSDVLRALAERSGMVLLRVERAASGDSEGPGCHELDYETEVAHYRFALEQLRRSPWVDPRRIVVFGMSLGSTTAPLVALGHEVAGVVVTGGGALTYFERMLAFDRLALERSGGDPRALQPALLRHAAFHHAYLLRGEDPLQIAASRPELAGVWEAMRGTGDGVHYGRPYAYHRQAAARNVLAAWADLDAPVLVLYAEHDQFEPRAGHRLIVDTVNRLRPGTATYEELPAMGHDYSVYPSGEAAMAWQRGTPAPELLIEPILQWLRARGLARPPG